MSDASFQAPSPEHLAGLLPQYDIEAFIAQGGMGAVYRGRQRSLERDVAVKVLPRELGEDPEFRESFTSEAKAMARLNHPNLIGVFDFGDVDGMPYIVMEYVQGCSLHESAWNQAIEPAQAVAIVKGICEGLAHAHEHDIIHRDIKPANILLTLKAEPKIGDFGLARATDSDQPGLVMGTPGYTAPEVFQDPDQAGPLADLYSVGVILHQLLTGIDPAGSEGPPTQATGNLRLDAIWRKATHINPAQRYPSVAAMTADLEKWSSLPLSTGALPAASPRGFSVGGPSGGRPAGPVKIDTGGGGGVLVKLLIIGVLVAVVVFTYQLLQEYKQDIKGRIADAQGHTSNDEPGPSTPQEPEPEPEPIDPAPEVVEPEPEDIAVNVEPEPVVEPAPEPEPEPEELPPGDPELRQRAIGLIDEARAKREDQFAENARSLLFQLGVRARRAQPEEAELIERLEDDVVDNRIPVIADVRDLPDDLGGLFEHAHVKEAEIEEAHLTDLTRIRDAYVSRLEGAAAEAEEELKQRLQAQAARAAEVDAWVELLSPEPERERIRSVGALAGGFAGHWDVQTDNLTQWVADRHGGVEINSGQWKGKTATWKMLDDGTVEVHWPDKPRPYVLTRNGDGWSGETSFHKPVSLTPGDW